MSARAWSPAAALVFAVVVGVGVGVSAPASAVVLLEDPFEGDELTLGGSVKSFFFGLHGAAMDLRPFGPDANPSALGLLVLRPTFEGQLGETWRFALHYEMNASVSSIDTGQATGPVALGRGLPPPRWLPLSWSPADHGTFTWRHTLDWAWTRVRLGPVDLTVGRQPVTFGRGYLWKTMDLLSTFAPTEIDTEYKPGADALRLDVALSRTALLSLVAVAGELADDEDAEVTLAGSSFAARAKVGFNRWEIGFFGGYVRRDVVFGVDGFVDLKALTLHAEATVTWNPDGDRAKAAGEEPVFARATAGVVWSVPSFRLVGELHYNGVGGADAGDYLGRSMSQRAAIGEVYVFGRYYAGLVADWEVHPLVHLLLTTMANLRDPSGLVSPGLSYSVATNVELAAGAYLPLGSRPDWGLQPRFRSEFGAYPYFYYLELKLAI